MRSILFLLLFFPAFQSRAQTPDDTYFYCPNTFYTDYYEPYITWIRKPASFSFSVFDRWGNRIFSEDNNPGFNFSETAEKTFAESQPYFMVLKYTLTDGKSYESSWQAIYIGFYCTG